MLRLYFGLTDNSVPVFNYFIGHWKTLLNIFFTPYDTCFHSGYVNIGRWLISSLLFSDLTLVNKFEHFMCECKTIISLSAGIFKSMIYYDSVLDYLLKFDSYFVFIFYEISSYSFLIWMYGFYFVSIPTDDPWIR